MTKGYIIIIASLWLSFPQVTFAGTALMRPLDASNRPVLQNIELTQDAETFFAQNEKRKTSDGVRDKGIEKTDEDATQPETLTKEKDAPKESKQLKPFIPSETIPADQGVDFPYNI